MKLILATKYVQIPEGGEYWPMLQGNAIPRLYHHSLQSYPEI